jgi:hypothetical protein
VQGAAAWSFPLFALSTQPSGVLPMSGEEWVRSGRFSDNQLCFQNKRARNCHPAIDNVKQDLGGTASHVE